jgi:FdrA protein
MNTPKIEELFHSKLVLINVGTRLFGDAAQAQGCEVIQVDWRPVANGDKKLQDILDDLGF